MAEDEKSLTNINEVRKRVDLKLTAQAEMRWLAGRMLARLLTKQLPRGFTCQYVKNGDVAYNQGEADSDELVISDSRGSVWARIHTGYLLGRQIPNMRVNENDGYGGTMGGPELRPLLKVLQQWAKEFQLTSNLEEILTDEARLNRVGRLIAGAEARRKARQSKTKQ
ncbi:MAG: hypothetical protein NTY61_00785 [Candidatus Parcubacteria bacterium]|nr:hypothetical protein [Candidatus Parcubacteria bacterium]